MGKRRKLEEVKTFINQSKERSKKIDDLIEKVATSLPTAKEPVGDDADMLSVKSLVPNLQRLSRKANMMVKIGAEFCCCCFWLCCFI